MSYLGLARLALALPLVFVAGCTGGSRCGAAAAAPPAPVEPAAPEPRQGIVRPCRVDDPGACAAKAGDRRVEPGQHYDVEVLSTDPFRGPRDARVTLVVFSDFQCPFCEQFESTVDDLLDAYPEALRIVWKDNPLDMHPHARSAALLARAAYERGGGELFWEVHEDIFDAQADFETGALARIAHEHELEWPPAERVAPLVDASLAHARNLGVVSTPTSFVNGRAVVGSQPLEAYTALIDEELARPGAP